MITTRADVSQRGNASACGGWSRNDIGLLRLRGAANFARHRHAQLIDDDAVPASYLSFDFGGMVVEGVTLIYAAFLTARFCGLAALRTALPTDPDGDIGFDCVTRVLTTLAASTGTILARAIGQSRSSRMRI